MTARVRILCLTACLCAASTPVVAQSLFSSSGLGLPMEAVDGRARALANVGLGLSGGALLPTDPAAAARLGLPTGVLVGQPTWTRATENGETNYFSGARFPLLAAAYPMFGGMVSVHFASLLDQDFTGERESAFTLSGQNVVAKDSFRQDGSVSSIGVGYARMINLSTAVALTVGRYTGRMDRTLIRVIEGDSTTTTAVLPYVSTGTWRYSGYLVTAGVSTTFIDVVNASASVTWSTALDAKALGSTEGGDGSFDLPLQIRLGASVALAPGLALSASAARADWSGVADDLTGDTDARAALTYGVGVELSQARVLGRQAPIRLGFRHSDLPFSLASESASERIFSGGLGLVLAQSNEIPLATLDLAIERGRRSAGGLAENFWRGTVSVRLTGI